MDEVVIMIGRKDHWIWSPLDSNGQIRGILVQSRRESGAASAVFTH
ncbi:MAG: hypothetical protein R3186_05025 [Ruegeria sp.]|nr:hypothetical protein [Ruegeria sp.]